MIGLLAPQGIRDSHTTWTSFWGADHRDRDAKFEPHGVFTTYLMDNEETAQSRAAALAAVPDVRCVAVVDLYSADDPSLVWWVHDDGGGARRGKEPPFPELLNGLRQFVHRLQTTAE
jgi:hypothetical protein